ncbi:MAG TPA: hypothetical protein VGB53_15585 [Rubricoccaceae bacterium]|jgi:hypothetical protein
MSRLALVALLLTTLAACDAGGSDSDPFDGLTGDPALLAGTWTWETSIACGDGSVGCTETTPGSSGRTETLSFSYTPETSSHNGTVQGFYNGREVGPTTYLVYVAAVDYTDRSEAAYYLGLGTGGSTRFGVSRERLVISDAAADGVETTYRRQR